MILAARILSSLVSLAMLASGVRWLLDPAGAAGGLAMPLLEGMGASTQIGDMSSFFLTIGVCGLVAQRRGARLWLLPAAMLLGTAAVTRSLATVLGHAPLGIDFIVPEIVMTAILVGTYVVRAPEDAGGEGSA